MHFRKNGDKMLEFSGLDPFLAELIKQIPCAADPHDDAAAKGRLYARPVEVADQEKDFLQDWDELVVPDLKLQFGSALAQVTHDIQEYLCEVEGKEDFPYRLQIPLAHADAWLSALNQARLVLVERFQFSDVELSRPFQTRLTSLRDLALYQISIYALLQELIITGL